MDGEGGGIGDNARLDGTKLVGRERFTVETGLLSGAVDRRDGLDSVVASSESVVVLVAALVDGGGGIN